MLSVLEASAPCAGVRAGWRAPILAITRHRWPYSVRRSPCVHLPCQVDGSPNVRIAYHCAKGVPGAADRGKHDCAALAVQESAGASGYRGRGDPRPGRLSVAIEIALTLTLAFGVVARLVIQ
jgi:hypothetical protein